MDEVIHDPGEGSIFEAFVGATLTGVRALEWNPHDEPGDPDREAYALRFGEREFVLRALNETSELDVSVGPLAIPEGSDEADYRIVDVSAEAPFARFVGEAASDGWRLTNTRGYADGFMVALGRAAGLCFVAMNNEVSVLVVEGQQFA